MKYLKDLLVAAVVLIFCQTVNASSENVTNIIELLDETQDIELVNFGCVKNPKNDCWVLVKTAKFGKLQSAYQIKLLQIGDDNKILQSIHLTHEEDGFKRATVTDFQINAVYILATVVSDNTSISIYQINRNTGEIKVIGKRELGPKEQSLHLAVLSNDQKRLFVVSRKNDAWPQIYATSLNNDIIWRNSLEFAGLRVSGVRDMKELGDSLVITGSGISADVEKGWVAVLNAKGELVELMMEDGQSFELFTSNSPSVLGVVAKTKLGKEKFGLLNDLLINEKYSNLAFTNDGKRRISPYHHMCGSAVLSVAIKKDETGIQSYISRIQIENEQAGETKLQSLNKKDSIYRNAIFYHQAEDLYIGSSYIKLMADRKLRVGIKVDRIADKVMCSG
jgi:hypothetical protein